MNLRKLDTIKILKININRNCIAFALAIPSPKNILHLWLILCFVHQISGQMLRNSILLAFPKHLI